MKNNLIVVFLLLFVLNSCVGTGSKGVFGTGVSIALDPRSLGTQIDDSIMQKTISAKILSRDKKYLLSVKSKVLDGRINIVISRQETLNISGVEVYKGFREALNAHQSAEEIMVIGGSEIYQLALPIASRLYITHIDKIFEGDTWFPKFNSQDWSVIKSIKKYESSTDTHYRNIIYDKVNV